MVLTHYAAVKSVRSGRYIGMLPIAADQNTRKQHTKANSWLVDVAKSAVPKATTVKTIPFPSQFIDGITADHCQPICSLFLPLQTAGLPAECSQTLSRIASLHSFQSGSNQNRHMHVLTTSCNHRTTYEHIQIPCNICEHWQSTQWHKHERRLANPSWLVCQRTTDTCILFSLHCLKICHKRMHSALCSGRKIEKRQTACSNYGCEMVYFYYLPLIWNEVECTRLYRFLLPIFVWAGCAYPLHRARCIALNNYI